jgi:transposase
MGRYKEAPFGFNCQYRHACPHLNGTSTTWASILIADKDNDDLRDGHFIRHAEKELNTLETELEKANAEIEMLRAENKRLHQRQFKPNRRKPPPEDPQQKPLQKKKRGPPFGHPPWNRRPPDHIDKTINVPAPDTCPHCGCTSLKPSKEKQKRCQEDIILQPTTFVTEFVHDTSFCPKCRRSVFQTAPNELRNSLIGPVTKATAVFMRHEVKLSYDDICKIFKGVFGMPFVPASAVNFDQRLASLGKGIYEDLRDKIRSSHIAHGDETSWRIDGQGAQLWYAGNRDLAFYLADPSRGGDVALSIFGENWPGNLVADDYAGYNPVNPASRQSCLAHLSRHAKEITQEILLLPKNLQDQASIRFCARLRDFFSECCALGKARNSGRISFSKAKAHKPEFQRRLNAICRDRLNYPKAENLRQKLTDPVRDANRIFTFLDINGMEPTNNHAEQSLRLPVIFRKICFGSRSTLGAQTFSTNLSLITTAKRQQRDPLAFLQTLLLQGPSVAQPFLYRNSPANTS